MTSEIPRTLSRAAAQYRAQAGLRRWTRARHFHRRMDVDDDIDDEIDITVVGAPASMTLAANPPSIACNGVNSSEVSATLLDSDGKPVVAGNSVRFEVVALGISDPIIAKPPTRTAWPRAKSRRYPG